MLTPWLHAPDTHGTMDANRTASTPSAATTVDPRQEKRVHLAVPVKVFPDIKSVESHSCCTYELSIAGARVAATPGICEEGQVIYLQRLNRRARYKVVWLGKPDTPQAGQMGVISMEPANVIWENEIKTRIQRG